MAVVASGHQAETRGAATGWRLPGWEVRLPSHAENAEAAAWRKEQLAAVPWGSPSCGEGGAAFCPAQEATTDEALQSLKKINRRLQQKVAVSCSAARVLLDGAPGGQFTSDSASVDML